VIKGKRNQLANVGNRFQTEAKKVVVVCSAGLLRSPTAANVLHTKYGFNTRAVGADKEFALIPLTQALIWWADEIVFVNRDAFAMLDQEEKDEVESVGVRVVFLNIEDDFDWMDAQLRCEILEQYEAKRK
jgi:predicted protein tyrosine phosphatase